MTHANSVTACQTSERCGHIDKNRRPGSDSPCGLMSLQIPGVAEERHDEGARVFSVWKPVVSSAAVGAHRVPPHQRLPRDQRACNDHVTLSQSRAAVPLLALRHVVGPRSKNRLHVCLFVLVVRRCSYFLSTRNLDWQKDSLVRPTQL